MSLPVPRGKLDPQTWTTLSSKAQPQSTVTSKLAFIFQLLPLLSLPAIIPRSVPPSPAGFVTINPGIYLRLSANEAPLRTNSITPTVILIFGWMGAPTRHLEKYSRKYVELYPYAIQVIVKCDPSFYWTSAQDRRKRLLPVVQVLESLGCFSSTDSERVRPRILVHSFSNGGGYQLAILSQLLSSRFSDPLISALIFDSSPSTTTLSSIARASTLTIRNPLARYPALALIYLVHAVRLVLERTLGWDAVPRRYPLTLLAPRLLPWMRAETPRLYVFSTRDEMVRADAVRAHMEEAERAGLNVWSEVYEKSAHVSHVRVDPGRYWGSVEAAWTAASRLGESECRSAAVLTE